MIKLLHKIRFYLACLNLLYGKIIFPIGDTVKVDKENFQLLAKMSNKQLDVFIEEASRFGRLFLFMDSIAKKGKNYAFFEANEKRGRLKSIFEQLEDDLIHDKFEIEEDQKGQ